MAQLLVVYWRDIPAQVIVKAGRANAKRQLSERFEKAIESGRANSESEYPPQHEGEQHDQHKGAEQAELLGIHGKDEVRMCVGQVEELLHTVSQADTKPFAAADRDQRLRQLESLVIGICPGIEEPRQAFEAVLSCDREGRSAGHREAREDEEVPEACTGHKHHRERDRDQDNRCADGAGPDLMIYESSFKGLSRRKSADWKMAVEVTEALRRVDPEDPVRYDFALFNWGMQKAAGAA